MVKDIGIDIRFNDYELRLIHTKMEELNIKSRSKYIRYLCLNGFIVKRDYSNYIYLSNEFKELYNQLNNVGDSLNFLARQLNSNNEISVNDILYNKKMLQEIFNNSKKIIITDENIITENYISFTNNNSIILGDKENVKHDIIRVRVSLDEYKKIEERMKDVGVKSRSKFIRNMCLNGYMYEKNSFKIRELSSNYAELNRELSALKNNIKQIARKLDFDNKFNKDDIYVMLNYLTDIKKKCLENIDKITQ